MSLQDEGIAESILGRPLRLRRDEVTKRAGVARMQAQRFWRAMGFPLTNGDDELFTEGDAEALARAMRLVQEHHLDADTTLALTRAIARSSERLTTWHTQLLAEEVAEALDRETGPGPAQGEPGSGAGAGLGGGVVGGAGGGVGDAESRAVPTQATVSLVAERVCELVDDLEPLLLYAWRRNLYAAVSRMMTDADPQAYGLTQVRSVGFADLVNFTSLVRKLSERDLGRMVGRFEQVSADVITAHGGRLIKTLGDEVVFTTVTAAPAAAIALDLVDAMAEDELLPSLRVGMARGAVVKRLGDVFGTTVNRAARLTAVAGPDAVLVDAAMARELATQSGFSLRSQRRRVLQGVGPVTPTVLRRATDRRVESSPSPRSEDP